MACGCLAADRVAEHGRDASLCALHRDFPRILYRICGLIPRLAAASTTRSTSSRPRRKSSSAACSWRPIPAISFWTRHAAPARLPTVAEQWGRRWITIDTSRVALALARARIMGARYPYYLLADSRDGQIREAEITRTAPSSQPSTAASGTASSTSEYRTSRSSRSRTTPRSTSSGSSGRRRSSRFATSSTLRVRQDGRNGRFHARPTTGQTRPRSCTPMVGGADRPAAGDRRVDRGQGRVRVPLRQAVRGQDEGPRRRPVHRREPQPAPHARRRRERRADRPAPGRRARRRRGADVRADDPRKPQGRRRPAGAQGGPDRLHVADAVAGRAGVRRGPVPARARPRSAPRSSSARSSARSSGRTSSRPRARPATPASTS